MHAPKKQCVYCSRPASTSDHVPPRCLLERPYPPNLPTVPSCEACNNAAAKDEEYFLAVLAQIATAPHLQAKIESGGTIDRAFSYSPPFEERIKAALKPESGRVLIFPELDRIHKVLGKITAGLYYRRYGTILPSSRIECLGAFPFNIEDLRPMHLLVATYSERFLPKRWSHVQRGVFSHLIVREPGDLGQLLCIMDFSQTLWGVTRVPRPPRKSKRNTRFQPHTPDLFARDS